MFNLFSIAFWRWHSSIKTCITMQLVVRLCGSWLFLLSSSNCCAMLVHNADSRIYQLLCPWSWCWLPLLPDNLRFFLSGYRDYDVIHTSKYFQVSYSYLLELMCRRFAIILVTDMLVYMTGNWLRRICSWTLKAKPRSNVCLSNAAMVY